MSWHSSRKCPGRRPDQTMSLLNLNQTVLRVAVNNVPPFCRYKILKNDQIIFEPSIEINYLKMLMKRLNFQVKFIDMGQNFGLNTNGTWDGVVGIVNRSEVHFGMCDLSVTLERKEAVDYTHYTMVEDLSFLTFAPEPKRHLWAVIAPFIAMVWACITLSILILSAIHYGNRQNRHISFVNIVLNHLAVILRQPIKHSKTSKILFAMWMLLGVIFTTCYVSVFFSTLTVVEYDKMNSLEDLLEVITNDRVVIRVLAKTHFSHLVRKATKNDPVLFYEIKKHFHRNKIKNSKNREHLMRELFQWRRKQPPVYIASKHIFHSMVTIMKRHRQMFISDQTVLFSSLAFAFPKGSPYLDHFSQIIQEVYEAGLSSYWALQAQNDFERQFRENPVATVKEFFQADLRKLSRWKAEPTAGGIRQLLLVDFRGLFYTFFAGIVIGLIVFLFELCYYLYSTQ